MSQCEPTANANSTESRGLRLKLTSIPDNIRRVRTSPDVFLDGSHLETSDCGVKRMKTLTCPKCGTEIPLEEAVTHQIREELGREFQARSAQREKAFADREAKLVTLQTQVDKNRETLDQEIERRTHARADQLRAQARKQAEADLELQLQDLRVELGEKEQKLVEARSVELEMRKKQRELASRQQALDLEVARKMDEERENIRLAAASAAAEEQHLRFSEKEKLIGELQKQIEALKQKAQQGSQRLQGEVLELEVESLLKQKFFTDEIVPISNGVRGADLLHRVKTASGLACGTIIWETKRTQNWVQSWIAKLKQDQRAQKAEIAVLVTQALPVGLRALEFIDGVWVTDPSSAIGLATALRQGLVFIANARLAADGKTSKMEQLYDYLTGTEFRQKVEAIVEAFVTMKNDLENEQRAFARIWARREKQIGQVITSTALMYGGIQGIVGQATLPEIGCLQLPGEDHVSSIGE